jgi:hypothetical protein
MVVEEYLRMKNLEVENENRLKRIKDIRAKQEEKELKIREKFKSQLIGLKNLPIALAEETKKMNAEISKSLRDGNVQVSKELNTYVATLSEIQRISQELFPKEEDNKTKKTKAVEIEFLDSPEEFEAKTLDLEGKMLSFQQRLALIDAKDKEERLAREKDFQEKSLQLTVNAEKEKARVRLEKYIEDINRKVESGKIDEFEAEEAIERAKNTSKEEVRAIEEEYQPLFILLNDIFIAKKKALGKDEETLNGISEMIQAFRLAYTGVNDFLSSEFDRQITIEQNRTNALNAELNQRLLNEQLSAEQRKSIQNQIWQNDEALRVRQEQIAKKKFRTEKAFNISMAIVDTYSAANKALNDPTPMPTFARFALAGATIAKGLLQVAAISRQQFQSSSANTPIRTGATGGDGGVGDRSFNFTLAGQTEGNQIVDAIQSQFSNPIRAYVVSGDVTNQQQLDANIQSSASF